MTPELVSFSDWTLALLPRLFLYPGGLWLLAVLLALRFASGGRKSISPRALVAGLSQANLLSLGVAWAAIALMPFPGASTLPSPIDSLALTTLPILSFLLDRDAGSDGRLFAVGAITLALILPAIESGSLLVPAGGPTFLLAVSSLAVISALLALLLEGNQGIAGEVRWLAWFCLGVVPLWQRLTGDSVWAASLFVLAGVVILNIMRNVEFGMRNNDPANTIPRSEFHIPHSVHSALATVIAWLLVLPMLLWVLLIGG